MAETTAVSARTAKADARQRLREIAAEEQRRLREAVNQQQKHVDAAIDALDKEQAHAAQAVELRGQSARTVRAAADSLGSASSAASVLGIDVKEIRALIREASDTAPASGTKG